MAMARATEVAPEVVDVLKRARVEEKVLYLPEGQLPRTLYEQVNEVLTRLGGTWKGRRVKGHIFEDDPQEALALLLETGIMPPKNPTAYFATPPEVIEFMIESLNASIEFAHGMRFLEPSAGRGTLALALRNFLSLQRIGFDLHCCEILPAFEEQLQMQGFVVVAEDFLGYVPHDTNRYHAIVMNPPFAVEGDPLAYATHILHAWSLLLPDGVLVAIAPPGYTYRQDKQAKALFNLVETYGRWEMLPEGSFQQSGTHVATTLLCMRKPHDEREEEETTRQGRTIPSLPASDLDAAYGLTQAIARTEEERKNLPQRPVFGLEADIKKYAGRKPRYRHTW